MDPYFRAECPLIGREKKFADDNHKTRFQDISLTSSSTKYHSVYPTIRRKEISLPIFAPIIQGLPDVDGRSTVDTSDHRW